MAAARRADRSYPKFKDVMKYLSSSCVTAPLAAFVEEISARTRLGGCRGV